MAKVVVIQALLASCFFPAWTVESFVPLHIQSHCRESQARIPLRSENTPPPSTVSSSPPSTSTALSSDLNEHQIDFCKGYLNKHHADLLLKIAEYFSPLGAEMAAANVWSGGSYRLQSATLIDVTLQTMQLQVEVSRRNQLDTKETVTIDMDADMIPEKRLRGKSITLPPVSRISDRSAIDDWTRRFARFCWILSQSGGNSDFLDVTGKLMQLAKQLGGSPLHTLAANLYLNQVPHNPYVRQYFYDLATQAVVDAVRSVRGSASALSDQATVPANDAPRDFSSNRLQVICQFPELNPSMDSYRIGTLLELVRAITLELASKHKLTVRICVQASMGQGIFTGIPKSLSGVPMLLQRMDWQSEAGQPHEGIVGTLINFGAVGPEHVQDNDDVFIVLAPQSMVGTDSSIFPLLQAMVERAGSHRPVILINPDLVDKPSSAGQQGVRGRQERIDFSQSFETAFMFQNLYMSGTSYFPILGAVTKLHPEEPWIIHQRRDYVDGDGDKGELYVPVLASETRPPGEAVRSALGR